MSTLPISMNAVNHTAGQVSRALHILLAVLVAVLVLAAACADVPWLRMWLLAAAIYFGLKALVLAQTRGNAAAADVFLWLWLSPTLNLNAFLRRGAPGLRQALPLAWAGCLNLLLGAGLLWGAAPRLMTTPLLAGWVGMVGFIFLVHFGAFHLATAFWKMRGHEVEPLMRCPVAASSLADFWGRRWNMAFRDAVNLLVFRPVAVRRGAHQAQWAVFVLSGLLHEAVVSVPAQGGWGGPTLYFLLQAAGIELGRRLRIRRGLASRAWAFAFLIIPLGLLFHPPFVQRVMLPFFTTLGALP